MDDLAQIHQLHALYGHVIDRMWWDRLGDVFTDDAVFDATASGGPTFEGLDAMRNGFPELVAPITPLHLTTNVVVLEIGDTEARTLAKFLSFATPPPKGAVMAIGEYEDVMRRTPDGWRIAHRITRRIAVQRFSDSAV